MPIELGLGAARILAASAGKATGVAVQCRTAADAAKQLSVASCWIQHSSPSKQRTLVVVAQLIILQTGR
jgi:hypothetical protein